jgi:hypothetical protein
VQGLWGHLDELAAWGGVAAPRAGGGHPEGDGREREHLSPYITLACHAGMGWVH